jgi:hypothetical protein
VLLTFDPAARPWLTDYLPEIVRLDDEQMPAMSDSNGGWDACKSRRFWLLALDEYDAGYRLVVTQ